MGTRSTNRGEEVYYEFGEVDVFILTLAVMFITGIALGNLLITMWS